MSRKSADRGSDSHAPYFGPLARGCHHAPARPLPGMWRRAIRRHLPPLPIRPGIDGPGLSRPRPSSPGDTADFTGGGTTGAGVLDSIAATIGSVPHVLLRDTGPGEQPGPIVRPSGVDAADPAIRYRIDGEIARGGIGTSSRAATPTSDARSPSRCCATTCPNTPVFALGSILCEVLAGEPAFLGRSSGEILRKAALGDTADALARLDGCGADAELIAIAGDCLAHEPEDRPRHAGGVAGRVTAYLAGVQDRLRAAELARAAESARAEEAIRRARAERRARRLQVGLAASLLVLTTAGGLTFTYLLHQRQERRARFGQILAEATALRDKARREVIDPLLWREALAALERAVGQGPEDRVAALRGEIRAGLDEAERVARLRQELVEIRANQLDVGPDGTDAAYAAALRAAGLDLEALEPAEFARRLRRQPEAVTIELSGFLDHWSAVRAAAARPSPPGGSHWRRRGRSTRSRFATGSARPSWPRTVSREAEALTALATAPGGGRIAGPDDRPARRDPDGPRPGRGGRGPAADRRRPPPRRRLGQLLSGRGPGQMPPSTREEAVRYYTAARALRPETAHELAHLLEAHGPRRRGRAGLPRPGGSTAGERAAPGLPGKELDGQGRASRRRPRARQAIRLQPDLAAAHNNLGIALGHQGKLDEAIAEYREAIRLKPDDRRGPHQPRRRPARPGEAGRGRSPTYREAIRLKPDYAEAHNNLGNALSTTRGSWTRPSPNTARRSGSSPTTPRPTTTSASP